MARDLAATPGRTDYRARLRALAARAAAVGAATFATLATASRRRVVALAVAGLLLRLVCSLLYGTQDIEWWKAWGTYAVAQSVIDIYGAPDERIVELWKAGDSRQDITRKTQTVIRFEPYRYFRTEYWLVQPPLYIYSLFVSTSLYRLIDHDLHNRRLFNVFINIQPILASAALAVVIGWLVGRIVSPDAGRAAGLVYWLNPLVILNAPIQGYQDPLCALFATASIVSLYRRRVVLAWTFLALATLTKPQGVLILPVVMYVSLVEHRLARNLAAWGVAVVTGLVVALPYILSGRFLSVIIGVLSISQASEDLTRSALNIWWPVQVIFNGMTAVARGSTSRLAGVLGGYPCWNCDVPARVFTERTGVPVQAIGLGLLAAFTLANLYTLRRHLDSHRSALLSAAALQVYGYFMLRAGVQVNHYFLLVPILALCLRKSGCGISTYALVCGVFILQDLVFYGFGRDLNPGIGLLTRLAMGWTTSVLALANVAVFVFLTARQFRYGDALHGGLRFSGAPMGGTAGL